MPSSSDERWEKFAKAFPNHPTLEDDATYALPKALLGAIDLEIPGFLTDNDRKFEKTLRKLTSALDSRIATVATVGGLASFVTEKPYENQRLGILVPGILRDIGDVCPIAALSCPRRTVIAGGVHGSGEKLSAAELNKNYAPTTHIFRLAQRLGKLHLLPDSSPKQFVASLS